ncbi:MAG: GNAT family N-acetyltransferase [Desulfovibrio sp.]|nr:GNAT family N-acetyltransferase [Desulfovibrio sp.]
MPFLTLTRADGRAGRDAPADGEDTSQARAFQSCLPHWERLAATTGQADPFCCGPEWQLAFHEALTPDKRLFYLDAPGGFAVFSEFPADRGRVFLAPPENGWLFGCPLLGPAAGEVLTDSLAVFDEAYPDAIPHLILSGIQPRGPLAAMLLHRFGEAYAFFRHASSVQCAASLAGGLDGFLARRSANHRAKLKKAARKAACAGVTFTREMPATPAEAAALYARMQTVEAKSWKGLGKCGMGEAPAREFYAALVQKLAASGKLRAIMATRDGEDIGFIFGGLCGATYRGQQFSYAATESRLSLGNLLQLATLQWLCEEGVERYDMGPVTGPRMEYKRHWTEENHEIQTWVMVKKP